MTAQGDQGLEVKDRETGTCRYSTPSLEISPAANPESTAGTPQLSGKTRGVDVLELAQMAYNFVKEKDQVKAA